MRSLVFLVWTSFVSAAMAQPGPKPSDVRRDRDGSILPEGAIARLGSRLYRDPGADRLYVADCGRIVACFEESAVRWWDLETGRYLRGWAAPDKQKVWFSADGRRVARAVPEGLEVCDTWNDRPVRFLPVENAAQVIVALSHDGAQVAVAPDRDVEFGSYPVQVWDIRNGAESVYPGLDLPPAELAFADAGRMVIARSKADRLIAWRIGSADSVWQINSTDSLRLNRSGGKFMASVGADGDLTLFDAISGRKIPEAITPRGFPEYVSQDNCYALSNDGRTMLVDGTPPLLWSWYQSPGENRKQILRLVDERPIRRAGAFSPDGQRAVLLIDQRLHAYDLATRKRLTEDLREWGQPQRIERVYWSADGRYVFTGLSTEFPVPPEGAISAWDAVSGRVAVTATRLELERIRRLDALPYQPESRVEIRRPTPRDTAGVWLPLSRTHTYSTDGALLAIGRMPGERSETGPPPDPSICNFGMRGERPRMPSVVETHTGRALVTLPIPHLGPFAFSPDARSLAVIEPDGVHLYDGITGREQLVRKVPMYPHSDSTLSCGLEMSFSPDGRRLAVIEHGGTVLVLDVALPQKHTPLSDEEADRLWTDLASPDPKVGWAAIFRLSEHPEAAVRLIDERVTPVRESDVRRLLGELASPNFRVREGSSTKLLAMGDAVRPAIAAALKDHSDPESRHRLESLAAALADELPPQAVDLQRLRALAVLERIGTKKALAKITELADGCAEARATREANLARKRLTAQNGSEKD